MALYSIDLSYLEEITGGDQVVLNEMLELFLDDTPNMIQGVRSSFENSEWENLSKEAHKLKPMFLYVGVNELHKMVIDIEKYAKVKHAGNELPELINKVETGFDLISVTIRNRIK